MEPLLVISNALQEIVVMNIEFEKYAQGEKFIVEAEAHDCITLEDKLDWTWWDNVTDKTEYIGASLCMDCFQKIFKDALPEATKERIMKEASRTSEDNPGTSYLW